MSCRSSGFPATCYVRERKKMCASSLSKRRCTDGQPTETSCRAHPAAGTPTWPLNGGQLRPARSVPASLGRWALQVEILPHGSGLTMDTATDRSRGRGGLDRIESDGGGGSGLMPPGRKNLSNSARPRHVLCEHTPPRRSLGFGAAAIASSLASGIQTRKHGGVRWQPRLPCAQHWQPS